MKIKTIISAFALTYLPTTFANDAIYLNDVVVTATRTPQPREAVIADVSVIDAAEIQRGGQTTLVELLQQQAGIEINNTGGYGKTSSIYMRGTNSGNVVVLIDGIRVSSVTSGTTALENLPTAQIEHIEILRGPASSLYGQDAIGGVIQIFTKKGESTPKLYASAGYGRYRNKTGEAGIRGKLQETAFAIHVSAQDIRGFSAYDTYQSNLKDNDPYRNFSVSANLTQTLAQGHEMGVQFFNSEGATHLDNRFNTTDFSSKSRLNQQTVSLFSNHQFTSSWLSKLRVGFSKDKLKNYDEITMPGFDRFDTEQTQINWQNDLRLSMGTLTLMYDRLEEDIRSNTNYDKKNRLNEGYVLAYLANFNAHSLQATVRDNHNSQFGSHMTGGIGYGYSFDTNWRASASYGSAFKAPTFNDLYYPFDLGNPNLVPEKSDNIEVSLRYQDETRTASITAYQNKIRDLIVFDLSVYKPFNINKATLKGLTFTASQSMGNLNVSGSLDIQSPRAEDSDNLLIRRAQRIGKLNAAYHFDRWQFGTEFMASSKRFENQANTKILEGYGLLNLTAQYSINNDWSLLLRGNNVLNKKYTLAKDGDFDYNTPGANLFINVRYQPQ